MINGILNNRGDNMSDELYTVAQTASYLKVCEKTVRRLIQRNTLIASKVGRAWRIKQEDIDAYLQNNTNQKGRAQL